MVVVLLKGTKKRNGMAGKELTFLATIAKVIKEAIKEATTIDDKKAKAVKKPKAKKSNQKLSTKRLKLLFEKKFSAKKQLKKSENRRQKLSARIRKKIVTVFNADGTVNKDAALAKLKAGKKGAGRITTSKIPKTALKVLKGEATNIAELIALKGDAKKYVSDKMKKTKQPRKHAGISRKRK